MELLKRRVDLSTDRIALAAVAVGLVLITAISIFALEIKTEENVDKTLQAVLNSTDIEIDDWVSRREFALEAVNRLPKFRQLTRQLMEYRSDLDALTSSPAYRGTNAMFQELLNPKLVSDYYILSPDNVTMATSDGSEVGKPNRLVTQPGLLEAFWSGEKRSSLLFYQGGNTLWGQDSVPDLRLVTGVLLRDEHGEQIGLLILVSYAQQALATILDHGDFGNTGKIYFYGNQSLFMAPVSGRENLGSADQLDDVLKTEVKLLGLTDYREGSLVGTWQWLPNLGFGLAVVQGKKEAYEIYYLARGMLYSASSSTVILVLAYYLVSARRRRELKASQGHLEAVFRSSGDSLITIDSGGLIVECNKTTEQMFGYALEDMVGKNISMLMPEQDRRHHDGYLERASSRVNLGMPKVYNLPRELKGRRKDGSFFPIEVIVGPLNRHDGSFWLGSVRDISQRRSDEAKIKKQQAHLARILEHASLGAWEWNAKLDETSWNAELYRIMELDEGVVTGRMMAMGGVPEPYLSQFETLHKTCMETGQAFSIEHPVTLADDRTAWLYTRADAVFDENGSIVGMEGTTEDITESRRIKENLRRSELALRESENHLSYMLDTSSALISTRDMDGKITYINTAAAQVTGLAPEEHIGRSPVDLLDPETADIVTRNDARVLSQGRPEHLEETLTIGGVIRYFYTSLMPLRRTTGEIYGLARWCTDVTDLKRTQAALEVARVEADASNQAKSAFLASMSHEIRTPMNGVIGLLDVLRRTTLDEEQAHLVGTINESSFALLRIIDDILDFSKIEAGKLDLEERPVSLAYLLDTVGETLLQLATDKEIDLITFCDPGIGQYYGDPVRIRQILYNIAGNAIKFTPSNGTSKGRVTIAIENIMPGNAESGLQIRVQDTGIGIPEKIQEQLFSPFTQAESSTTREYGGTGLGLSISKRLAEMMGGDIYLQSAVGEGTVFTTILPLRPAREHTDPVKFSLQGTSVLLPGRPSDLQRFLKSYLAAVEVNVTEYDPETLLETDWSRLELPAPVLVIAIDMPEYQVLDENTVAQLKHLFPAEAAPRFLELQSNRQRPLRVVTEGYLQMDYNCLSRDKFLDAVARGMEEPGQEGEISDAGRIRVAPDFIHDVPPAIKLDGRILIAEDNAINRKVISYQLELLGLPHDLAEDGVIALSMWQRNRQEFALLLTDCHMPNMDGYDLARNIRRLENPKERLPIIAITADAMKGTREECLEAGMDDYLPKPVQIEAVSERIMRWLPTVEQAAEAVFEEVEVVSENESDQGREGEASKVIDRNALPDLLGTDDPDLLAEFFHEFLHGALPTVEAICEAIDSGGLKEVSALAHKLKSSAASVGANDVHQCCLQLEVSGKSGGGAVLKEEGRALVGYMESAREWILEHYPEGNR